MFITTHGPLLSEAFHASTSFMPSSVAGFDPYLNSVQWSRRFLGLRLFLALESAGWEGLGAHVERAVAVIDRIKERLVAAGWTVANDSGLAVLDVAPARFARGGPSARATGRRLGPRLGRTRQFRGTRFRAYLRDPRRNDERGHR